MQQYLKKEPARVKFEQLYLDPNNPRIAPDFPPGYSDPTKLFDPKLQSFLEERVKEVYDVSELEEAIIGQGWVPVDAILVWTHPGQHDKHVVVEGNTRTIALRNIRKRLEVEKQKLARYEQSRSGTSQRNKEELKKYVEQLERIVEDTNEITVYRVNADSSEELQEKLPRLLGVRHIAHSQAWKPYAKNYYVLSLYEKLFVETYGADEELCIDAKLVKKVAEIVSQSVAKTKRNIQTAAAFSHFKLRFEQRLPEGEKFVNADHYFFENILSNPYVKDQFGWTNDELQLAPEMEEVLFHWAFSKPRPTKKDENNENILSTAEDFRLWNTIRKYDDQHSTSFSTRLNVDDYKNVPTMEELAGDYHTHKANSAVTSNLSRLLTALQNMKAEDLTSKASHVRPILLQIEERCKKYLKMIEAGEGVEV